MGQIVTRLAAPLQQCSGTVSNILKTGSRKRKRSTDSRESDEDMRNTAAAAPKKKKIQSTTAYIYQALFKEEKNSDISVMALGTVWKLHKVYLCQSPYFQSMFSGSWKESCDHFVHIKILDERITSEALNSVFGAMYCAEIEIDPKAVVSILAAATLFHLEGIIDKCEEVMVENISIDTAVSYYEAACQYGVMDIKQISFDWLQVNLLSTHQRDPKFVRNISIELMTQLISSPHLYVMQTEFSLYNLLRSWVYMRLHPNWDPAHPQPASTPTTNVDGGDDDAAAAAAAVVITSTDIIQKYFSTRSPKCSFLATAEGHQYLKPFQALRTQYLTNHCMDLNVIESDNIIPKGWLYEHIASHWRGLLHLDHQSENFSPQQLPTDIFNKNCMRCGRHLADDSYQKWRWTGFNYGIDLVLIMQSRMLTIRRHHRAEHERLLSLQARRKFMIRASITSINGKRQPIHTQNTEIMSLSLEKNEESLIMLLDPKIVYPLFVSVNLLVEMPANQEFKQHLLTFDEAANMMPISEIGNNCEPASSSSRGMHGDASADPAAVEATEIFLLPPASSKSIFATASTLPVEEVPSFHMLMGTGEGGAIV